MRKIIVPVDFSIASEKAIEAAVAIARKVTGEIGIVHVNRVNSLASMFGSHKAADSVSAVEKSMESLVKKIDFKGIAYATTLRTGSAAKEIGAYAEEANAYILVNGIVPDGKDTAAWLTEESYKILTSSPCPVLTVPVSDRVFDLKKIVIPIDTTITTRHKVPFTAELAAFFRAEIYVLATCVDESQEFVSKLEGYCYQVRKFLNQANVPNEYEFMVGSNIPKMCVEYEKKINADMVAIMTDQEPKISSKSTFAYQMIHQSPVPVLSMHKSFEVESFQY